ncbi:MAG TPA: tail fiber domain-containing protein [Steroidobacteraceae bacterium]|nr:tail fiber domain-containing protein [Steroidobacteraceae bacterium]
MKHILRFAWAAGLAGAANISLGAEPVTVPNTFTAGTPARAAEVNANFSTVVKAINDDIARLTTLETHAAQPDVAPSGNLVLGASTATSGNIVKDGRPFAHNHGDQSTFLGIDAGNLAFTTEDNTGFGFRALTAITGGDNNSAFGTNALTANTNGNYNTAIGAYALQHNTSGVSNVATGHLALSGNTTGTGNTAVGEVALRENTANGNTAVGFGALQNKTAGEFNVAIGYRSLLSLTTGERNTAIGLGAGVNLLSGDRNVYISNAGVIAESDAIRIGQTQSRTFIAGIRGVTTANVNAIPVVIDSSGQLGTTSSSRRFKEDIADMGDASSLLMRLRPVTFYYRSDQNPKGRSLQYGLVAEEVAEVAPGLVAHSGDGEVETVFYEFLPPMLLNEFQKQQRLLDTQQKRLIQLQREVAALRKQSAH